MKRKLPALAALVALLACALGGAALAAAGPALETEVSIRFQESIHFDPMRGEGGMDIDWGIQPLPMPGVHTQTPAPDGAHTLRVRDGRVNAGNWSVNAKWSAPMLEGSNTVATSMFLFDPTCSAGLTPNLSGPSSPPYILDLQYVVVDINDRKIMDAGPGLTQGSYDLTAAPGNARIRINTSQAANARPNTYSTTIVWTLTLTVP